MLTPADTLTSEAVKSMVMAFTRSIGGSLVSVQFIADHITEPLLDNGVVALDSRQLHVAAWLQASTPTKRRIITAPCIMLIVRNTLERHCKVKHVRWPTVGPTYSLGNGKSV